MSPQNGSSSFKELEEYVMKHGEAKRFSGKQEKYEMLLNQYC